MISQEKQEILEKSLLGNLSPDEQLQFNEYCEDKNFQEELQLWKEMQPVFEIRGRQRLKERLQAQEKSLPNVRTISKSRKLPFLIAIAASIAILFGVLFFQPSTSSGPILFAEYFRPAENTVFLITRGSNDLSIEAQAYSAYGAEQYRLAIQLFNQLVTTDTISFYVAMAHLNSGEIPEAEEILTGLTFDSDPFLQQSRDWYLALAHLVREDKEAASKILKVIAGDANHPLTAEATILLSKL